MEIMDLIDEIGKGDAQASNNAFNELMSDRMNTALNSQKQEIAGSLYGTPDTTSDEDV